MIWYAVKNMPGAHTNQSQNGATPGQQDALVFKSFIVVFLFSPQKH